ncbi:MAG: preprotein translocase subunit Sec61beta [Candidatus Baldrarchaeia archaeon]
MSRKSKKKRREGPMPVAGAGLIRFFQDETRGIKVGPVAVILLSLFLIILVGIAWLRFYGLIPFP